MSELQTDTDTDTVSPIEAQLGRLLGRPVECDFEVVRWRANAPAVVRNAPFTRDGTPMPTRYWLADEALRRAVSRLESDGGVLQAASEVDSEAIAECHRQYAAEREAAIAVEYTGPRPSGGVGGTRIGLKCLHAHLAYWLAGGEDPVGAWVAQRLEPALVGELQ